MPGICGHRVAQPPRHLVRLLKVAALDLHVDGRRQAEVEHLADDVGGLEVEAGAGEIAAPGRSRMLLHVAPRSGRARA